MEARKTLNIPEIPDRLRLAYFRGTDAEQAELEKLEAARDGIFSEVFRAVSSGAASVAWWTVQGGASLRILHRSTRYADGLQLSRLWVRGADRVGIVSQF